VLYLLWAWGGGGRECRPIIVTPFSMESSKTVAAGSSDTTRPPLSCTTPSTGRPLMLPPPCGFHATFKLMDIDYRSITVEISSITAVTLQQATPSPRYYRKFHLQNCGIPTVTAVLPPSPLPCRALAPSLFCHRAPDTIVIGTVI